MAGFKTKLSVGERCC